MSDTDDNMIGDYGQSQMNQDASIETQAERKKRTDTEKQRSKEMNAERREQAFQSNKSSFTDNIKPILEQKFAAALASAGGAFPDAESYYRNYNQLHRLDYFDAHVTGNIHIFMTRPNLYLCAENLAMDNTFLGAANTPEGCLILASLCEPFADLDTSSIAPGDSDQSYFAGLREGITDIKGRRLGDYAYSNLKTHGIDKLGATPFIPIVSNLSTSISGIKDINLEKFEYDGDQSGHRTADAMGLDESLSNGEASISFIENSNLGISMLTYLWLLYMDNTGKGIMNPSASTIENLEYDYMSSIFWFVTGQDGMSIKLFGKLTGIYPVVTPLTSLIPNERGSVTDPKVQVSWHFNHSEIMKPEIIYDFNYLIDNAAQMSGGKPITKGPNIFNDKIRQWYENSYKDLEGPDPENKRINKFMATGSDGVDKLRYNYGVYEPNPQNTWFGHPYVLDGKLVYKRHESDSAGTTHAATSSKKGFFAATE